MVRYCLGVGILAWSTCFACAVLAADDTPTATTTPTVEQLAKQLRPSLAVFHVADRDGRSNQGIGTGFIISADGLIATNLHVIGEGRAFTVELSDGSRPKVLAVHAADRHLDLAIVRIEPPQDALQPLPLASEALPEGSPIVVMGNPFGLKHSVVSGLISGKRVIDDREMLQLAIPIEPGNSGGPVVDRQGRVHGIVTMKSLVSENLGFAVDVSLLKKLQDKPNQVPLDRWTTIGRLNPKEWQPLFGANWRQRAGRISVDGAGEGFGGRSLCLSQSSAPEVPFEVAVNVKLNDEQGAAGLVFHSDGGDRHYGFYPSAGRLRLTCFQGPTVYSWQVLREEPHAAYRPGDWNRLRVRVEAERFLCYVNDQVVFESSDSTLKSGAVGLAKFRDTQAEFRQFQLGADLGQMPDDDRELAQLREAIASLPPVAEQTAESIQLLSGQNGASLRLLRARAEELTRQAEQLRQTATDVHVQYVVQQLQELAQGDDFDLLRAALQIARLDEEELEIDAYVAEVERMSDEVRQLVPADGGESAVASALDQYLFREQGFHGSRHEYYHRANSHLHRVIEDREGLPITLSVLYLELGRRLGLKLEGVGLPGHYVVRYLPTDGEPQLIDVFEQGAKLTLEDARRMIRENLGLPMADDEFLRANTSREIAQRMLRNLLGVAEREQNPDAMRSYLEALVAIAPEDVQFRGMRAITRFQTGRRAAALADLDWFLTHEPPGVDLDRIREMRTMFESQRGR